MKAIEQYFSMVLLIMLYKVALMFKFGSKTQSYGTLGFLLKSPALREKAYRAIPKPKTEFCSSIWDPRKGVENRGTYQVGMVQRRAAQ